MKKIRILLISILLLLIMPISVFAQEAEQKSTGQSTEKTVYKGLVQQKGDYYYYKSGKKLKSTWKTINGKKYFFNKKGKAAIGAVTIKKKTYLFNQKGRLVKRKVPTIITVNKKSYCATSSGIVNIGWQVISGKLYYFSAKTSYMVTNKVVDGIPLTKKGYAETSAVQTKLKKKTISIVKSITNNQMSKAEKLQNCYNYMINKSRFQYRTWRNFQYYKNWEADYAYEMLEKNAGNCYNFAVGFAYLAKEVGYDVYVIRGRIPGSRDGAGDGLTRHSWVMIDGLHYDPEGQYAGFVDGYGLAYYPMRHMITDKSKI